jgi:GNAT superfamily N-acetyltransferase
MQFSVRSGRADDREGIASWTRDTFSWGDYVGGAFDDWLADEDGRIFVAEAGGRPIGMARVAMLSPEEAWSQGARIHPEYRRRGVGKALGDHIRRWAEGRGARVIRLAIENWNRPAQEHVRGMGFAPTGHWLMAERGVGENSPVPEGNGGRRVRALEGIRPAPAAEAEPALLSWASGPLERAARGLFPIGWSWRRLRREDLLDAARRRALWEGRVGWAVAEVEHDTFRVSWISTTELDADAMTRALLDRAAAAGVERIEVMAPDVDWLRRSLRRSGCELHPITLFSLALG